MQACDMSLIARNLNKGILRPKGSGPADSALERSEVAILVAEKYGPIELFSEWGLRHKIEPWFSQTLWSPPWRRPRAPFGQEIPMTSLTEKVPLANQPRTGDYAFDLDQTLS